MLFYKNLNNIAVKKTQIFLSFFSVFFSKSFFFLSFFLSISLAQCSSGEAVQRHPNLEQRLEKSEHFQRTKVLSQDNVFDRGSYRMRYLVLRKSENGESLAKEIEISLYSYSNGFLSNAARFFPGKTPKRYLISEKVKMGTAQKSSDGNEIDITFHKLTTRQFEEDDLITCLDVFLNLDYKQAEKYKETAKFKLKADGGLWKKEETRHIGKKTLTWKNHEQGGLLKRFAYIEYKTDDKETTYSRLHSPEEYTFEMVAKDDAGKPNKLFQNRDYIIYYFPGDDYSLDETNTVLVKNNKKQITLYKNKFPILVYKKNLNYNEPGN